MAPEFDELVGDVDPGERERLKRTHDLLVAAGPPPELPPALRVPPGAGDTPDVVRVLPRGFLPPRRAAAALVLAAALALAAFGAGYLVGHGGPEPAFAVDFVLPMQGTRAAPDARASLEVGERDKAGNWPMRMTVRNLAPLPEGRRYELLLTKNGRLADSCGTFEVEGDRTVVFLNAPYQLKRYDGWVVTPAGSSEVLLTSSAADTGPPAG
jgi:hypothetical protein